jgi:hypothetical protein
MRGFVSGTARFRLGEEPKASSASEAITYFVWRRLNSILRCFVVYLFQIDEDCRAHGRAFASGSAFGAGAEPCFGGSHTYFWIVAWATKKIVFCSRFSGWSFTY